MLAEKPLTYEKWYECQCDIGYDVDEEWIHQEVDHALADILSKAGLANCMWRNNYGGVNWSVGGYDDYVTFDVWIELQKVPKDHDLRLRFPFAFLAHKLDIAYEHEVCWLRGTRTPHSLEYQWQWSEPDYDIEAPLEEGTVYDGMAWVDAARLMQEQTDELMEVLKQYADDACYLAMCTLREDYDWFYSESRYNEEIE
jgi:hypothetical protein